MRTYILERSEPELRVLTDLDNRKILNELKKAYPTGLTTAELIERTESAESTIYTKKSNLLRENFIKELKPKRSRPGRPSSEIDSSNVRSSKFIVEDANYLNYSKDRYRLAPGNVEYSVEFINIWNRITDIDEEKELHKILLHLIEKLLRRVCEAENQEVRQWAPTGGPQYCCLECGMNHEVRDFIRASLLRLIDRFEISTDLGNFLKDNEYISEKMYSQFSNLSSESITSELKMKGTRKKSETGIGLTTLRILSIQKDTGEDKLLFLAINKDQKFLCGTIDKELVTDEMASDSMIECLTNDIKMDTEVGSYIGLSKDDAFVKVIDDNPEYPRIANLMSTIETVIHATEDREDYIVEGIIANDPEFFEVPYENRMISGTEVTLQDNTGQIPLNAYNDQVLNRLHKGDKILVIGALLEEHKTRRWLHMSAYGSIIKIGTAKV